uniref:Uncharacterized protein n=1 Tax=Romanomermis culicivorax TaxID=13658 RepID=A0A915IJ17_ROMCU
MNKFDTEQRLATAEDASEASHVEVEISFYNPFDIVDVSSVEQSARRLNVSASMAVYLIGRYTWEYLAGRKDFNITDLLLMSKSDNDYGMKNLKASMIMKFLGSSDVESIVFIGYTIHVWYGTM